MDAYASLVAKGLDVEKSEAILADLMAIYIKRFEDVPTNTISLMKETDWDGSLKEKVENKTVEMKISLPAHHETQERKAKKLKMKTRKRKTTKKSLTSPVVAQKAEETNDTMKVMLSVCFIVIILLIGIILFMINDNEQVDNPLTVDNELPENKPAENKNAEDNKEKTDKAEHSDLISENIVTVPAEDYIPVVDAPKVNLKDRLVAYYSFDDLKDSTIPNLSTGHHR